MLSVKSWAQSKAAKMTDANRYPEGTDPETLAGATREP